MSFVQYFTGLMVEESLFLYVKVMLAIECYYVSNRLFIPGERFCDAWEESIQVLLTLPQLSAPAHPFLSSMHLIHTAAVSDI